MTYPLTYYDQGHVAQELEEAGEDEASPNPNPSPHPHHNPSPNPNPNPNPNLNPNPNPNPTLTLTRYEEGALLRSEDCVCAAATVVSALQVEGCCCIACIQVLQSTV